MRISDGKRKGSFVVLPIACLLVFAFISAASGYASEKDEKKDEKKDNEVKVWVNLSSKVYHCPGTRWYGKTKKGKFMGECEARASGYRPAYGKACGSSCSNAQDETSKGSEGKP